MTTSGAEVAVVKTGDVTVIERLRAQYRWLVQHDDPGLVKALRDVGNGYAMELLSQPRYPIRADAIVTILERAVWNRPPTANWDLGHSIEYFMRLERGEELWSWLWDLNRPRMPGTVPTWAVCDTHGDPTFENVLARGEQLVLVDPIPADGRLPSLRALDLGKIGQSLIGYEAVKAGKFYTYDLDRVRGLRPYCRDEEEFKASLCFTAIHVARLIPYQEDEQALFWREQLGDIITHLQRV